MSTHRTTLLIVVVLILTAAMSALGQTSPLARLRCDAATFPSCGWGLRNNDVYSSMTLATAAGPWGQHAVQVDLIPGASHAQYYMGWLQGVQGSAQGATRYLRVRLRLFSPLHVNSQAPESVWGNKFIILGDGGDEQSRVMVILTAQEEGSLVTRIQRNIDGDPNRTPWVRIPADGVWHHLQWEVRSSSATGAGDGHLKFWQDGDNARYGNPTSQSGDFVLSTAAWSNVCLGYYASGVLVPGVGVVSYQLADFEYDDEFDSAWSQRPQGVRAPASPAGLSVSG